MPNYTLHDPLWFFALALLPLSLWLRGRRRVPVLLVPFAAAWHRPSLASASRWPTGLAVAGAVQGGLQQLVGATVVPGTVRVGFGADRGGKGGTTG